MKKFIAFLLTAILGIVALTGCGSSTADNSETSTEGAAGGSEIYRTLDEIKESGTIKIGVFSDKNPFGYVDENGEYQGYDIYFAERLAKDLGVEVEYVPT